MPCMHLWQPQDFHLCEQRKTLVFSSALQWDGQDERKAKPQRPSGEEARRGDG